MKKFNPLHTMLAPAIALVVNLFLAYMVYFIARVAYMFENFSHFSENMSVSHFFDLYDGGIMFDTSAIVYTNMLYIVMMLFPLHLKETKTYHKICKWVFVVVNSLTLVLNLGDSVYFPYTQRRTTTSVFQEFGNENNLAGIFFHEFISHWYLVLLAALIIWGMWKLYVTPAISSKDYRTWKRQLGFAGVMLLCLAIATPLAIGGCRGGLGSGIRPITINNANQYVERPVECAVVLNTPFALLRTIGKSVFNVPAYYATQQELDAVYTPIHHPQPTHPFVKKNVVVLIVESFAREFIGAFNHDYQDFGGGKYQGYTPYVDKLIEKSLIFKYSYANGRKSIDGMPSVLSSIPMFIEPFVLTPASMNDYTGIAGILGKEGYETAFFHGANRGSMGFMAFANKTGFQKYYGRQDYEADERFGGPADFDTNWGIWDEPFLQYYCTKMGEMKEPFMTALFTVSSHHPFVVPEKYEGKFPKGTQPVHQCIGYTDMAIGKFFESASKQPWFKNTIFVLTSDHTSQIQYPQFKTDLGYYVVPVIIYDPSGEIQPGVSESIAQQIDIMPTVLSYLGYDKPYLAFGIDLLTTPAEETFAVNYDNGTYQYVKYGHVLQFNGEKATALYRQDDIMMTKNIVGKEPEVQAKMEREVKAIIQQYMYRMVNDKMLP